MRARTWHFSLLETRDYHLNYIHLGRIRNLYENSKAFTWVDGIQLLQSGPLEIMVLSTDSIIELVISVMFGLHQCLYIAEIVWWLMIFRKEKWEFLPLLGSYFLCHHFQKCGHSCKIWPISLCNSQSKNNMNDQKHVRQNLVLMFYVYTTARPLSLDLLCEGWGDAFLLLLLLSILLLRLLLSFLLLLSAVVLMILLLFDREFKDFMRWGWSFFISDNWTGFNKNSSAPPSKHRLILEGTFSDDMTTTGTSFHEDFLTLVSKS